MAVEAQHIVVEHGGCTALAEAARLPLWLAQRLRRHHQGHFVTAGAQPDDRRRELTKKVVTRLVSRHASLQDRRRHPQPCLVQQPAGKTQLPAIVETRIDQPQRRAIDPQPDHLDPFAKACGAAKVLRDFWINAVSGQGGQIKPVAQLDSLRVPLNPEQGCQAHEQPRATRTASPFAHRPLKSHGR